MAAGINEGGHYFRYFWSERRCAGGALQQGNAVTSVFVVIFSFFLSFGPSVAVQAVHCSRETQ